MKGGGGRERIGPYVYRWEAGCFPVTADSLALGEFVTLGRGERVLDMGCGAGLLLLKCAAREPTLTLLGVESDPACAALARENLAANGLDGIILTGDAAAPLPPAMGRAAVVVTNPPWFPPGTGEQAGPAKTEGRPLAQWLAGARRALIPGGRCALVHQAGRLVDVLEALRGAGLEPKRLQLIQHTAGAPASAVLVEGVLGGAPGLSILPARRLCEEG